VTGRTVQDLIDTVSGTGDPAEPTGHYIEWTDGYGIPRMRDHLIDAGWHPGPDSGLTTLQYTIHGTRWFVSRAFTPQTAILLALRHRIDDAGRLYALDVPAVGMRPAGPVEQTAIDLVLAESFHDPRCDDLPEFWLEAIADFGGTAVLLESAALLCR
jgi:hypothetical protein